MWIEKTWNKHCLIFCYQHLLGLVFKTFAQCSVELLLTLKVAAVRAEALLSPDLHVEHSPLNDAYVRVVQLIEDALCLQFKELKVRDRRKVQLLLNNRVLRWWKAQYYGWPFTNPWRKKSHGVKSGEFGAHGVQRTLLLKLIKTSSQPNKSSNTPCRQDSPSVVSVLILCFFLVLRIFWEEQLAEQFWYFNFSLY